VTSVDGAATIGAVAVALNTVAPVQHLALRTPTLDDVFLELTGNRMPHFENTRPDITSNESCQRDFLEVERGWTSIPQQLSARVLRLVLRRYCETSLRSRDAHCVQYHAS
jgi:hypothetical protein